MTADLRMITPRAIAEQLKPGVGSPAEVERLYRARDERIAALASRAQIEADDVAELDRTGRCIVASEHWTQFSGPARQALLNDAHHFVRSTAVVSLQGAA